MSFKKNNKLFGLISGHDGAFEDITEFLIKESFVKDKDLGVTKKVGIVVDVSSPHSDGSVDPFISIAGDHTRKQANKKRKISTRTVYVHIFDHSTKEIGNYNSVEIDKHFCLPIEYFGKKALDVGSLVLIDLQGGSSLAISDIYPSTMKYQAALSKTKKNPKVVAKKSLKIDDILGKEKTGSPIQSKFVVIGNLETQKNPKPEIKK